MGHIDRATGRNKREDSPRRARDGESKGGGIRRQNGRPAESRAEWRRRTTVHPVGSTQPAPAERRPVDPGTSLPWELSADAAHWAAPRAD